MTHARDELRGKAFGGSILSSATATRLSCTGKHINYGVRARHTYILSWDVRLHLH